MKVFVISFIFFLIALAARAENSCLVVRDMGGHRLRNGVLVGSLTLGLGAIPAAAMSGQKYKRVAAFGAIGKWRSVYKPKDLQRLDERGTQVIVLAKDAEINDPAKACGYNRDQSSQSWTSQPMQMPMQPMPQPAPMAQSIAQPVALPRARTCIATLIDRAGNEVCTQYSPQ